MKSILILTLIGVTRCEELRNVFPYNSELQEFFELEESLLTRLETYTDNLQSQIEFMERTLRKVNQIHSQNNTEENHPFASYRLIARFTRDWLQIEDHAQKTFNLLTENDKIPSSEIFIETSIVFAKLQKDYNLSTADLVKGKVADVQSNVSFSWKDSISFGYELYRTGLHNQSKSWFREGVKGFLEENITDLNFLDNIRKVADHIGYTELSDDLKTEILKIESNFLFDEVKYKPSSVEPSIYADLLEDRLCRGEDLQVFHNLSCSYVHYNNPYLLLGPHKLEVIHTKPFVGLIHDVLSDGEIKEIERNSVGKLERSKVVGPTKDVYQFHKGRTSTSAHVNDESLLNKVVQRMSDMTNLEVARFADDYLTITNYGIGSFYKTHHDIFFKDIDEKKGNRIATVMFYLSNVDVGGSTVFPDLKLNVRPQRGSALVWFNLKKSGDHSLEMRHAACSLVKGEKLIATYWISERGNEFKRPCGTDVDDFMTLLS